MTVRDRHGRAGTGLGRRSLRVRLVLFVSVTLVVVCAAMALTTVFVQRVYLLGDLDQRVTDAAERSQGGLQRRTGGATEHYPVRMGATAMGWTLGFGRLGSMLAPPLLGLIIGAGLAFQWNFYALAVPGVIGAVLIALVPRAPEAEALAEHGGAGGTARPLAEQT
ncbi:hypothetical protein [Streptomyces aurantiogriseus]|uniref:MFS transporter n=1 Tax=Streptomyces aurantiogriseus TaxID=66870 RepID=A0A918FLR7_9ACTN|nr:hypothetical protein GCM10010251_81890 [Streptomyces aurantiogriseus]